MVFWLVGDAGPLLCGLFSGVKGDVITLVTAEIKRTHQLVEMAILGVEKTLTYIAGLVKQR